MGKACFTVNTVIIKTIRQTQCSLHIAVVSSFSLFFPFFSDLVLLFSGYEKRLLQSIFDTYKYIKTIVKEATSQGISEIFRESQELRKCALPVLKEAPEKIGCYEYGEFYYGEFINYY